MWLINHVWLAGWFDVNMLEEVVESLLFGQALYCV